MSVRDANEQARGLWDRYAPRYDRHIRLSERLLEPVTIRLNGDYLTRRPLPLVEAAGFAVTGSERLKLGIIERLTAVKP